MGEEVFKAFCQALARDSISSDEAKRRLNTLRLGTLTHSRQSLEASSVRVGFWGWPC